MQDIVAYKEGKLTLKSEYIEFLCLPKNTAQKKLRI